MNPTFISRNLPDGSTYLICRENGDWFILNGSTVDSLGCRPMVYETRRDAINAIENFERWRLLVERIQL